MIKLGGQAWALVVVAMGLLTMIVFGITKAQVEAKIGGQVKSLQVELDNARDNRDSYRENSTHCAIGYERLKDYALSEDYGPEDIKRVKADIARFDKDCELIPGTGVGGR